MIRIPILIGGVAGCVLGALLGLREGGVLMLDRFALCYLSVGLADLSTHFSNSYFDVEADRFSKPKTFGKENPILKKQTLKTRVLMTAEILTIISLASASISLFVGVPPTILLLALSFNVLGWMYSLPPFRLVSRGVGEVAITFATGFIIPGAGYLATYGVLDKQFLEYSAPLMFLGFVLSLCLELPDIEADYLGGKNNIAVRLGWRNTLRLALLLALISNILFYIFYGLPSFLFSCIPSSVLFTGIIIGMGDHSRLDVISTASVASLFLSLIGVISVVAYV
jgi:1,4-dihydroxy-2-naphthoate octaprenyltransferase